MTDAAEDARDRWSAIAHTGRRFASPIDEARFARFVDGLPLPPSPRAVDLGCGRGGALAAVARARGGTGVGVDRSARMLEGADDAGGAVTHVQADAGTWQPGATEAPDLAMCIGSTHIFGGLAGAAAALAGLVGDGATVVLGDGYWQADPADADLAAFGMPRDELVDLAGVVAAVEAAGLVPVAVQPSTTAEWDDYEWTLVGNVELWCREHPDDPGAEAFLARTRAMRDSYVAWRREAMGFVLVAAVTPSAGPGPAARRAPGSAPA